METQCCVLVPQIRHGGKVYLAGGNLPYLATSRNKIRRSCIEFGRVMLNIDERGMEWIALMTKENGNCFLVVKSSVADGWKEALVILALHKQEA